MTREIIILGAGGHGRVCAEVAAAAGFAPAAFCDPAEALGEAVNGIALFRSAKLPEIADRFDPSHYVLFVAIGDNDTRMRLNHEAAGKGYNLPVLLHPSAVISPSAQIGAGTVAVAHCTVNANARIGMGCILNTACSLDHDNVLEDGVQICPGVRAAGNVQFGEKAFVGTGAVLVPGIKVGREAHIAAGSVVIADVAAGTRVRPFPARGEKNPAS